MSFVDFAALKERVAIDDVLSDLGLQMKHHAGQWRGPCPTCKTGGNRALVITPEKSAFYCFGGRNGGDVIALVAHIRGLSMKDAGLELARMTGKGSGAEDHPSVRGDTVPEERNKGDARSLQPLAYLQPDHELVAKLGLSHDSCEQFGAGYAPKGIMRGRLAIPIHDLDGNLVAYCGQTVRNETPALIFPNGFDPVTGMFNAHRMAEFIDDGDGEVILVHDPIEVMLAWQNGIPNTVSFLTEALQPSQLEMLATAMRDSGCEKLHFA